MGSELLSSEFADCRHCNQYTNISVCVIVKTLISQVRQHSVALISLAIAQSSLGYNTWRNEQTEANRNARAAGIEQLGFHTHIVLAESD